MNAPSAGSGGPPRGPQFDNRRVIAGLIDVGVVLVIALVVGFVMGLIAGPDKEIGGVMPVLVLAWGLFYYFACESAAGQTLGKRIMGLRVRMVDGSDADMRAIGARTVLRIIDGIALYLVGLIAMLATGQRRQRLGDLAGKTIVTAADWSPSTTGAMTSAAAVAAPSPSAIVLPAAAPENPTATPSPLTPLAADPTVTPDVTSEPPSVSPEVSNGTPDAPSVTSEPPSVSPDGANGTPDAPSVTSDAPDVIADAPSATPDLPSVAPDAPSVTSDAPDVTEDVPSVTSEPAGALDASMATPFGDADDAFRPVQEPTNGFAADLVQNASSPPVWNSQPATSDVEPMEAASPPVDGAAVEDSSVEDDVPAPRGDAEATESVESEPAAKDPIVDGPADGGWEPVPEGSSGEDEPVKLRSVETMSAMDMLMSELEEDEAAGHRPAS